MDLLNLDKICDNLPKNRLNVFIFDEINSTNTKLKEISQEKEISLVLAEKQTLGRGRHGKHWQSEDHKNVYMSLCCEKTNKIDSLSSKIGVLCANSINNIIKKNIIGLKWPNDLIFKNKKVGGILIESEVMGEAKKTIIGIGINLSLSKKESWWTDLSEFKYQVDKNIIINKITQNFIKLIDDGMKNWHKDWENLCIHLNQDIEVLENNKIINQGIFIGIDDDGSAIVKNENGYTNYNTQLISIKGVY